MKNIAIERTQNYLSQIRGSVTYKAVAMGASFLAIPLMIRYLGQESYGVWSTLLTVMSWLVFFDFGVGNGVRNKVAEALAVNNSALARDYIATGCGLIGLIAAVLFFATLAGSFFVPWQHVFNTGALTEPNLRNAVQVTLAFVTLNFWLSMVNSVIGAVQKAAITALGQMISNVVALALICFLSRGNSQSITYIALVYGLSITLANAFLIGWFRRNYSQLCAFPFIIKKHVRPLLSFGLQFFVIQSAVLVVFATDKILITQLLGPQFVAQYDVTTKLFGVIVFAHALVSGPLWSAYTDAFQRNDFNWIKSMLHKQHLVFLASVALVLILGLLFGTVAEIWVGDAVRVDSRLVICAGIFTIVSVWNNVYAMLSNGIGKIRLQMITALTGMLLNVPLAFAFVKIFNMGIAGIVLANVLCLLIGSIALPVQMRLMFKNI